MLAQRRDSLLTITTARQRDREMDVRKRNRNVPIARLRSTLNRFDADCFVQRRSITLRWWLRRHTDHANGGYSTTLPERKQIAFSHFVSALGAQPVHRHHTRFTHLLSQGPARDE